MNGPDYFGLVFMLLWGVFALWFFNKLFLQSKESLSSLVTEWPTAHPKEFYVWAGMSTVMVGLLCLLLFRPSSSSVLAEQHLATPGTSGNVRMASHASSLMYNHSIIKFTCTHVVRSGSDQVRR